MPRLCDGVRSKSDRKSTRLNSSHGYISYAVFCLTTRPPSSTLFPYTTLFRSEPAVSAVTQSERIERERCCLQDDEDSAGVGDGDAEDSATAQFSEQTRELAHAAIM